MRRTISVHHATIICTILQCQQGANPRDASVRCVTTRLRPTFDCRMRPASALLGTGNPRRNHFSHPCRTAGILRHHPGGVTAAIRSATKWRDGRARQSGTTCRVHCDVALPLGTLSAPIGPPVPEGSSRKNTGWGCSRAVGEARGLARAHDLMPAIRRLVSVSSPCATSHRPMDWWETVLVGVADTDHRAIRRGSTRPEPGPEEKERSTDGCPQQHRAPWKAPALLLISPRLQ